MENHPVSAARPNANMAVPDISARAIALDLLAAVLGSNRPLNEAFDEHPALVRLNARDTALARNIITTTIRRLGQIDALIDACLVKPIKRKDWMVHDILRLGVCQLLFMRTPSHAAVDTAVSLTKKRGFIPYAKLVNAVLRRLDREGRAIVKKQDPGQINTPEWLWESWVAAYGEATAHAIADAHLSEAPLDITLKGPEAKAWAKKLDAEILPTGTLRRKPGGRVEELPGYEAGAWWVQDAAAALPVRLLGNVKGKFIIDLCAAPGGKTAQLAAMGAHVTAVDRSARRLKILESNLTRTGLKAETVVADAGNWRPPEKVDAVLLDAPCSATGTIRRHPDVPYLKSIEDVAKLSVQQLRLLSASVDMLKPGGLLVYCACSLQAEEGRERIAAILNTTAPLERVPIKAKELSGIEEFITKDGDMRTLPNFFSKEGGMDGFFAARLRRQ